jgi:hypothetical protein
MKLLLALLLIIGSSVLHGQPGRLDDGRMRLANGWILDPAGISTTVGGWGRALALSSGGALSAVLVDRRSGPELMIISNEGGTTVSRITLRDARPSLSWDGSERVAVAGGTAGCAYVISRQGTGWAIQDSLYGNDPTSSVISVALQGSRCAMASQDSMLVCVDLRTHAIGKRVRINGRTSSLLFSAVKDRVYATSISANTVQIVDVHKGNIVATIPVGRHPSALAEDPVGERLFVACAYENLVMGIDCRSNEVVQRIGTSPFDVARKGTTPCALALSPNRQVLAVATADLNMVTLFDVHEWKSTRVAGFVPTGRLPVGVGFGDHRLVVLNSYGVPARGMAAPSYAATLSFIPLGGSAQLNDYTMRVTRTMPTLGGDTSITCTPPVVPDTAGGATPINHIVLVLKGGRSYDDIFGDVGNGNGARDSCRFPAAVTPNQHALAREFVLMDNVYADAEVREEGESWMLAGYVPMAVREAWSRSRTGRKEPWVFTGQDGVLIPPIGYLWDYCDWRGKRLRAYGTFSETRGDGLTYATPGVEDYLSTLICQDYPAADRSVPDTTRVGVFSRELDKFQEHDVFPALSVVSLANDRIGTEDGVRDCDAALGRLVERVSASSFWPSTLIIVVETDAEGGRDHVDPHRIPVLLISPYIRRGTVDHTMYTTGGLLHLLGRIVGTPPMSVYDASARIPCSSFTSTPDVTSFTHFDTPARGR